VTSFWTFVDWAAYRNDASFEKHCTAFLTSKVSDGWPIAGAFLHKGCERSSESDTESAQRTTSSIDQSVVGFRARRTRRLFQGALAAFDVGRQRLAKFFDRRQTKQMSVDRRQ
jgi:hypothetical protein